MATIQELQEQLKEHIKAYTAAKAEGNQIGHDWHFQEAKVIGDNIFHLAHPGAAPASDDMDLTVD